MARGSGGRSVEMPGTRTEDDGLHPTITDNTCKVYDVEASDKFQCFLWINHKESQAYTRPPQNETK
jgi:hypothetical protein